MRPHIHSAHIRCNSVCSTCPHNPRVLPKSGLNCLLLRMSLIREAKSTSLPAFFRHLSAPFLTLALVTFLFALLFWLHVLADTIWWRTYHVARRRISLTALRCWRRADSPSCFRFDANRTGLYGVGIVDERVALYVAARSHRAWRWKRRGGWIWGWRWGWWG